MSMLQKSQKNDNFINVDADLSSRSLCVHIFIYVNIIMHISRENVNYIGQATYKCQHLIKCWCMTNW